MTCTSIDFKLTLPPNGFKLVKYPDSFQATVVQTTNRGYDSFNEAHKGMAQLVLYSERATSLAAACVAMLLNGEPADIEDFLPIDLDDLVGVTRKSANLTAAVVAKYTDLIQLTHEMLATSGNAHIDVQHLIFNTSQELEAVRAQWLYLAGYFQKIVDLIESSLSNTMQDFIDLIESGRGQREKTLLMKDMKQISEVAKKVQETAGIYSEVSQRYLLKSIANLGSFAGLDRTRDAGAIASLQAEILQDCRRAEQAILNRGA